MHLPVPRTRAGQLRRRLQMHNLAVAGTTAATVAGAVLVWAGSYVISYWLLLLFLTSVVGSEARVPLEFHIIFAVVALGLFGAAWIFRKANPHARAADKKSHIDYAFDFLLTPPRLTFAIFDNVRAWQSLKPPEFETAVELIDRVRAARKLPMHSVPVEIPDQESRDRIIVALLHLEILELGQDDRSAWLRLVVREAPPVSEHLLRG